MTEQFLLFASSSLRHLGATWGRGSPRGSRLQMSDLWRAPPNLGWEMRSGGNHLLHGVPAPTGGTRTRLLQVKPRRMGISVILTLATYKVADCGRKNYNAGKRRVFVTNSSDFCEDVNPLWLPIGDPQSGERQAVLLLNNDACLHWANGWVW